MPRPKWLREAQVTDVRIARGAGDAFGHAIEADIKNRRGATYLITGGVGSGKTTFLRRHSRSVSQKLVEEWCVWLHVDFLKSGAVDSSKLSEEIRRYFYSQVRVQLKERYPALLPSDGASLRKMFETRLEEARMTRLYGLKEGSPEWLKLKAKSSNPYTQVTLTMRRRLSPSTGSAGVGLCSY